MRCSISDAGLRRIAQAQIVSGDLYQAILGGVGSATPYMFTSAVDAYMEKSGISEDEAINEVGEYLDILVQDSANEIYGMVVNQYGLGPYRYLADAEVFEKLLREESLHQVDLMASGLREKFGVLVLNSEKIADNMADSIIRGIDSRSSH